MVDTELYLSPEDNLVLDRLRENGEAWIVGGWVRETLLMTESKSDLDIATTLLPKEVIEIFPRTIPVGEEYGTVIVRLDGESEKQWEVTTLRKDGTYGDGRRPDNVSFGTNIIDDFDLLKEFYNLPSSLNFCLILVALISVIDLSKVSSSKE